MKNVYIASCAADGGLLRCSFGGGELIPREFIPLDRPMYMAMGEAVLQVLLRAPFSHSENSGLVSISLDAGGCMTELSPPADCLGRVSSHLSIGPEGIYTANYISGDISLLPDLCVSHGEGAHPHYIAPTPDGEYIAAADLGTDSIYTYDRKLKSVRKTSLPRGSGCRHIAFSPDGRYAYCANEKSSTVSVMHYERGKFTLLNTVSALPEEWEIFNAAAAIRCDNEHVWISHRGFDHISRFERRGDALSLAAQIPCGGRWPRDFILAGDYIICANEKSDSVTVLLEDKPVSSLPVKCPIALISG